MVDAPGELLVAPPYDQVPFIYFMDKSSNNIILNGSISHYLQSQSKHSSSERK